MLGRDEIAQDSKENTVVLPWPPSGNTLWRHSGGRLLISKKYREYKEQIQHLGVAHRIKPLTGRLVISILAYPPDNRRRDLDNLIKATLDSLQGANFFLDDSQFDKITIERNEIKKSGQLLVTIWEIFDIPLSKPITNKC